MNKKQPLQPNSLGLVTLVHILHNRALHQPDEIAYTFLPNGEITGYSLTYQALEERVKALASRLQSDRVSGARILLLYSPGLDFIIAFLGCLYAGAVAVPAYPPRNNQNNLRLEALIEDAQVTIILTITSELDKVKKLVSQDSHLKSVEILTTDDLDDSEPATPWQTPSINPDTLAFLQYTSGSTGKPKGVMISHSNLMHNLESIKQAFALNSKSVSVTWLPHFHDMGLIDGILQPLYTGFLGVLMPPVSFLQQPIRWLQAISYYRATHCGGPNFCYNLCASKITPQQQETLDLSSWQSAYNGAEPIRRETLEQFTATFQSCGFQAKFFYPCYGMAEATLMISGGLVTREPVYCSVDADKLEQHQVIEASSHTKQIKHLVGCGHPWLETKIVITDPERLTRQASEGVGEIWVASSSIARGYWNRQEETEQTFHAYLADTREGPFLRTGDLGFTKNGELFITGRLKDLIIIRGRNYYPQDIELTVEKSHEALRPNCGAAFSIEVDGIERLIVIQEIKREYLKKLKVDEVMESIRRCVWQEYELQVYGISLLSTASLPKTSSGKIQRRACRSAYLTDSLNSVGCWQVLSETTSEDISSRTEDLSAAPSFHNYLYCKATVRGRVELPASSTSNSLIPSERSDQHTKKIIEWLRQYASKRLNSRLIDERRCIPPYVVLDLGNQGILGMQIPEYYGGLSLSYQDTLRVFQQLGAIDLTLASFVGVNHALGTRPIVNYAKACVKDDLLPLIAQGRELAAFAITEPGAGSQPQALSSRAIPCGNGQWRLRGNKIWTGSGSWAGSINLFVQLQDARQQPLGITGFVVRQGTDGLEQGSESLTMGMRGMVQNRIYLNDVPVSMDNLLGELTNGMEVAQDAMMFGRLGLGAISVGGMKRCAQLILRYASKRTIATGRLLDNPITLTKLNDLTSSIVLVERLISKIAELLDRGFRVPEEAYIACKISGPEFLWKAADDLVQILGGRGYIDTNIAPQILRDARLMRIFEGPTETLQMFLGSRLINKSEALQQLICDIFKSPREFATLQVAAREIYDRATNHHAPFADATTASRWAYGIIGQLATFAILKATVIGVESHSTSTSLAQAYHWSQLHFDTLFNQALTFKTNEAFIHSNQTLTNEIGNYRESIGYLEQTLAGEDHELDEWLKIGSKPLVANLQPTPAVHPDSLTVAETSQENHPTLAFLIQWMGLWLSEKLKLSVSSIDQSQSFANYGLDSVMAVELAQDLETLLNKPVEPMIIWNYTTPESLANYLVYEQSIKPTQVHHPDLSKELTNFAEPFTRTRNESSQSLNETEVAILLAEELTKDKPENGE